MIKLWVLECTQKVKQLCLKNKVQKAYKTKDYDASFHIDKEEVTS